MARIKATHLLASGVSSAPNAVGSVVTASISPTKGRVILVAVGQNRDGTTNPTTPSISGCNMTWTLIATAAYVSNTSDRHRINLFRGVAVNPVAGALTISQGGGNCQDLNYAVTELRNAKRTGTNGSDAIVQSVTGNSTNGTLTQTLAAFENARNGAYAFVYRNAASPTGDSDFTTLNSFTGAHGNISQFADTNQTTHTVTGDETLTGIFVELRAAPSKGKMLLL